MADTLKTVRPAAVNINQRRRMEEVDLPPLKPHAPAPAPRMRPDEEIDIADARAEPPAAPAPAPRPAPTITLSTTVEHRGRLITITTTELTADAFCDLLDRRGFGAPVTAQQWQTLPDGTPICPKHHAPMRQREKQGDSWWSHNVGTKDAPVYCKGYHGKDSPGYEH